MTPTPTPASVAERPPVNLDMLIIVFDGIATNMRWLADKRWFSEARGGNNALSLAIQLADACSHLSSAVAAIERERSEQRERGERQDRLLQVMRESLTTGPPHRFSGPKLLDIIDALLPARPQPERWHMGDEPGARLWDKSQPEQASEIDTQLLSPGGKCEPTGVGYQSAPEQSEFCACKRPTFDSVTKRWFCGSCNRQMCVTSLDELGERLGRKPAPAPDGDIDNDRPAGSCTRCGEPWPDARETLEPHVCPPGFTAPERDEWDEQALVIMDTYVTPLAKLTVRERVPIKRAIAAALRAAGAKSSFTNDAGVTQDADGWYATSCAWMRRANAAEELLRAAGRDEQGKRRDALLAMIAMGKVQVKPMQVLRDRYAYGFVLDGNAWLAVFDPSNERIVEVPDALAAALKEKST